LDSFAALARGAGWNPALVWTDPDGYFSVHALAFGGRTTG
jgi:L-histidine Nalpha-methyltransferase